MKHVIITGANAGIGFATSKILVAKGFKISMFCRDMVKATQAKKEIESLHPTANIDLFQVDFASLASIEAACAKFKEKYQKLDVLINNAGATFAKYEKSADGIEMTMAVNHFGYFAMTHHLLPLLLNNNSRIINVASKSHFGGEIDYSSINEAKGYFVYKQYENSKLANVLFTKYLATKLADKGVTVNCLHPGVVKTKIGNKAGNRLFGFAWSLFSSFGINTEAGAETSVYLASSDDVQKMNGMYFDKKKAYKGAKPSREKALQQSFWQWSEEKSGLSWQLENKI